MKIGKVFKILGATFLLTTVMAVSAFAAAPVEYEVKTNSFGAKLSEVYDDGPVIVFASNDSIPKYYSTDGKTWIPLNLNAHEGDYSIYVGDLAKATKFYFSNNPSDKISTTEFPNGHVFIPAYPKAPVALTEIKSYEINADTNEVVFHAKTTSGTGVKISSDFLAKVGYGEWGDLEGYTSTYNPVRGLVVQLKQKPTAKAPESKIATYTLKGLAAAPAASFDAKSATLTKMPMPKTGSADISKQYALVYRSEANKGASALTADEVKVLDGYWFSTTQASVQITTAAMVNISGASVDNSPEVGNEISPSIQASALKASDKLVLVVRLKQVNAVGETTTKAASQIKLFANVTAAPQVVPVQGVDYFIDVNTAKIRGTATTGIDYSFDNKTWKTLPAYVAATKSTAADLLATAKKVTDTVSQKLYVRTSATLTADKKSVVTAAGISASQAFDFAKYSDYTKDASLKTKAASVKLDAVAEAISIASLVDVVVQYTSKAAATATDSDWIYAVSGAGDSHVVTSGSLVPVEIPATGGAKVTYRFRTLGLLSDAAVDAIVLSSPVKTVDIVARAATSIPSSVKIDFTTEKLAAVVGYQAATASSVSISTFAAGTDISITSSIGASADKVYIRKSAVNTETSRVVASTPKELVIPDRPEAPSTVTVNTSGTTVVIDFGSKPSKETKVEWRKTGTTGAYTVATFNSSTRFVTMSGVAATGETVDVRFPATTTAFSSKIKQVTPAAGATE